MISSIEFAGHTIFRTTNNARKRKQEHTLVERYVRYVSNKLELDDKTQSRKRRNMSTWYITRIIVSNAKDWISIMWNVKITCMYKSLLKTLQKHKSFSPCILWCLALPKAKVSRTSHAQSILRCRLDVRHRRCGKSLVVLIIAPRCPTGKLSQNPRVFLPTHCELNKRIPAVWNFRVIKILILWYNSCQH